MIEDTKNAVESAVAAGVAMSEPHVVVEGRLALALVPSTCRLTEIDLEKYKDQPARHRGNVDLADADSFIAYVNRFKNSDTMIYGDKNATTFQAVFNDHSADEPGWRDFTASYACPVSPEWTRWHGNSQHGEHKRGMTQATFAQFIEDNLLDITTPEGAVMLEVSRSLEAKKDVKFASAIRLSDGAQQFTYEEDVQGTAQKGQLQIPQTFTITIPVFEGGQNYAIDARLRYRIEGGKLTMWYELVRPHKVLEHAFNQTRDQIYAGITDTPLLAV